MPQIIWTRGADTITFEKGMRTGPGRSFEPKGVVVDRLAGGEIAAYDLGVSDIQTLDFVLVNISKTKFTALEVWKDTTVRGILRTFQHEDQSENPSFIKTVRLVRVGPVQILTVDPLFPLYNVNIRLQVEPAVL